MKQFEEKIGEFVAACRKACDCGLLRYSSGNLSCRLDDELVAVSASRSWLGDMTADDVVICRLADGEVVEGKVPTVESLFHLGTLRCREDMNVVLHFQSAFATAIACGDAKEYNFNVIPEIPVYIGEIGYVEYLPPGSKELADAVVSVMCDYDLAMLQNHGQVVVGKDFGDAIQKAGFFELACEILMRQGKPRFVSVEKKGYEGNA